MSKLSSFFQSIFGKPTPQPIVQPTGVDRQKLIALLRKHEGVRLKAYLDCCGKYWRECTCINKGKLTIGTGRNLDDVGISGDENDYLLQNDIDRALYGLSIHLPWHTSLTENRQIVLIDMCFNLGISKLLKFEDTLSSIQSGDYEKASEQMLESKWAVQVGNRAIELSEMMKEG